MTELYRLVKAARADDVLSGEGARRFGGRWNPPGRPVVYAAESRALAVLEAFVHLTDEARGMRFLLYAITLPVRARLRRYAHEAPGQRPPPVAASRAFGGAWLDESATLGLVVPSVIVPRDTNYVLNVLHPQFLKLKLAEPEPFSFDERLWRWL